ncbi:hypothetical protein BKL60_13945 [Staphylococcus aureus]|nr:hypothetical protein BKL60_13945 [Staphylococcus aureus]
MLQKIGDGDVEKVAKEKPDLIIVSYKMDDGKRRYPKDPKRIDSSCATYAGGLKKIRMQTL